MSSAASSDRLETRRAALMAAYREACRIELRALKPGNVHIHAGGHGMTLADFETSAEVSAAPLCVAGLSVGLRLREAARATREAVGCNTNLGILLLAAPLLATAEIAAAGDLRAALEATLEALTVEDAVEAYEAIRTAEPAGLGSSARQDVGAVPTIGLRQAMALAADRDRIARQYATGFADVFEVGVPHLKKARAQGAAPEDAAGFCYMALLAAFPDSHIARKYDPARAEAIRNEARAIMSPLQSAADMQREATALLAFDRSLKDRGINPGTTADLTVASLLALALMGIVGSAGA